MSVRIIILLLTSLLTLSCAVNEKPVASKERDKDILYVLPDGSMMFKGRLVNKDDVVIYDAAQRGERAAIKLIIPLHPDAYRDNINVERQEIDVAVERK
jgi:hypothetical protein